ncbi:hypothetical protein [Bradyrhizobium arachidis]|uniref:Uncharacterized protein n=1 Tax=Bradyrhizobium arachidis TaxID=858423 RepID=A0AAE7NN32_9BRAD|nr:hypothetical protein [Bradyrhizobium arachidis]QOZ66408.1 hypothetical protein WN72_08325 [Bradyrhizobium arachidis]SFV18298.1 hypothetical protein SAMN05192541_13415 [Bradyrhizobium arachidis]
MSNRNPTQARAGHRARFSVSSPVRTGFLKHTVTLSDRVDGYYDGMKFTAITGSRALRAAWAHAGRIVGREADHGFDYSA